MSVQRADVEIRSLRDALAMLQQEPGQLVETDVEVEVQKNVKGSYPDTAHVLFKTLPETLVASATCKGSYEQMGEVNAAVAEWVAGNGYVFDGPMFNIYHVSPHETSNPEEYVTEVCYPVKKA